MKKLLFLLAVTLILASCNSTGNGELIGVQDRQDFYQPDPFGMTFIPLGSYTMGGSDQDVPYAQVHQPKTVSVSAFYMDETEITNNEYRQFVYWVRDSIAHSVLGEADNTGEKYGEHYILDDDDKPIDRNLGGNDPEYAINWNTKIDWAGRNLPDGEDLTNYPLYGDDGLYLTSEDQFFHRKQIDTRKLFYKYWIFDLKKAAKKQNRWQYEKDPGQQQAGQKYTGSDYTGKSGKYGDENGNNPNNIQSRNDFVMEKITPVYPDTLVWVYDYTYSYNEPLTKSYFSHPAFDNYPVVGVTWTQARAFSIWRTEVMNSFLTSRGDGPNVNEFRLPTEAEWEWAARGGWELNPFPWGGPYLRNQQGCFLANFKPERGNYPGDGGNTPVIVAHYPPNDFGLFDMSGNVQEWTINAYDEAAYNVTWDLNPAYTYTAEPSDPPVMKRKVVRGGSWKDVNYYLQVSTRSYEYQDSANCYTGFRNVQSYLGRMKDDDPSRSSHVYN